MFARALRLGTLLGAIVVIASACGSSSKSTSGSSTTSGTSGAPSALTASQLDGKKFASTSVTGHSLVAGTKIVLTFDAASLGANAGCNTMSASYAITGGTLKWTSQPRATLMACGAAEMAQDQWLTGFLTTGANAALAGDKLTLTQAGTTIELTQEM